MTAPTWTPTRAETDVRRAPSPAAHVTVIPVSPAAVAQAPARTPAAPPTPLPTVVAPTARPLPTANQDKPAASRRIDAAGPAPLPTVAALPVGEGRLPVRLLIPALDLDVPVEPMGWHVVRDATGTYSEWDVVDNAAGHHVNSAYAGEAGNVVLSGHNNIGGAIFRTVCVIGQPGVEFGLGDDLILIDEAGRRFVYRVNGWRRTPERNASLARQAENARYMQPTDFAQLTLVTCWPPSSNTHRVVVTGLLVDREGG